jgi:hypothetical protein
MKTLTIAFIIAAGLVLGSPNAHADWFSDLFSDDSGAETGGNTGVMIGVIVPGP